MSDYPMLISNKLHSFRNFTHAKIHEKTILSASTRQNKQNIAKCYITSATFRFGIVIFSMIFQIFAKNLTLWNLFEISLN